MTKVTDKYRWLENWEAPEVRQWSDVQNVHARNVIDRLPNVDVLRQRVAGIMGQAFCRFRYCQVSRVDHRLLPVSRGVHFRE